MQNVFRITIRGLAALGLCAATLLVHTAQLGEFIPGNSTIRDAMHGPGFFALTLLLMWCVRPAAPPAQRLQTVGALVVVTALLAEAVQIHSMRSASLADLAHNGIGIGAGLAAGCIWFCRPSFNRRTVRLVLIAAAVSLGLLAFFPLSKALYVTARQALAIPRLTSFGSGWTDEQIISIGRASLSAIPAPSFWPTEDTTILSISPTQANYSGIRIRPYGDWTEYRTLSFALSAAGGPTCRVFLRILDKTHNFTSSDRYNQRIRVSSQPTVVKVSLHNVQRAPVSRLLDIGNIRDLAIFTTNRESCRKFWLGDIRLSH